MDKPSIFYAFPSGPPDLVETINNAAAEITESGLADIRPWPTMSISGGVLLRRITESIDQANVFACDLTHVNDNVLFELGYAIGKNKPV